MDYIKMKIKQEQEAISRIKQLVQKHDQDFLDIFDKLKQMADEQALIKVELKKLANSKKEQSPFAGLEPKKIFKTDKPFDSPVKEEKTVPKIVHCQLKNSKSMINISAINRTSTDNASADPGKLDSILKKVKENAVLHADDIDMAIESLLEESKKEILDLSPEAIVQQKSTSHSKQAIECKTKTNPPIDVIEKRSHLKKTGSVSSSDRSVANRQLIRTKSLSPLRFCEEESIKEESDPEEASLSELDSLVDLPNDFDPSDKDGSISSDSKFSKLFDDLDEKFKNKKVNTKNLTQEQHLLAPSKVLKAPEVFCNKIFPQDLRNKPLMSKEELSKIKSKKTMVKSKSIGWNMGYSGSGENQLLATDEDQIRRKSSSPERKIRSQELKNLVTVGKFRDSKRYWEKLSKESPPPGHEHGKRNTKHSYSVGQADVQAIPEKKNKVMSRSSTIQSFEEQSSNKTEQLTKHKTETRFVPSKSLDLHYLVKQKEEMAKTVIRVAIPRQIKALPSPDALLPGGDGKINQWRANASKQETNDDETVDKSRSKLRSTYF